MQSLIHARHLILLTYILTSLLRYLLLSMLGKGGFSEVWKAYDLVELKEVAVKVQYNISFFMGKLLWLPQHCVGVSVTYADSVYASLSNCLLLYLFLFIRSTS